MGLSPVASRTHRRQGSTSSGATTNTNWETERAAAHASNVHRTMGLPRRGKYCFGVPPCPMRWPCPAARSEEHTSELQSREKLVCRLLLEKKKEEMQLRQIARHEGM